MAENLEELKKQVFYDMLNIVGRVFIVVKWHRDVIIGKRGFLAEEKENGLVLVFNREMNFTWDNVGISTTLVFGQTAEKCSIPHNRIMTIFSPELNAQFSVDTSVIPTKKTEKKFAVSEKKVSSGNDKVIKVEFGSKK